MVCQSKCILGMLAYAGVALAQLDGRLTGSTTNLQPGSGTGSTSGDDSDKWANTCRLDTYVIGDRTFGMAKLGQCSGGCPSVDGDGNPFMKICKSESQKVPYTYERVTSCGTCAVLEYPNKGDLGGLKGPLVVAATSGQECPEPVYTPLSIGVDAFGNEIIIEPGQCQGSCTESSSYNMTHMQVDVLVAADDTVTEVMIDDVSVKSQHPSHTGHSNIKTYTRMVPRTEGYLHAVALKQEDISKVAKAIIAQVYVDGVLYGQTSTGAQPQPNTEWKSLTGATSVPPNWGNRAYGDSQWSGVMECTYNLWGTHIPAVNDMRADGATYVFTQYPAMADPRNSGAVGYPFTHNCGVYQNLQSPYGYTYPAYADSYYRFKFVVGEAPTTCLHSRKEKVTILVDSITKCDCSKPCKFDDYNTCVKNSCPYSWTDGKPGQCQWRQWRDGRPATCGCPENNCQTYKAKCNCQGDCQQSYGKNNEGAKGECKWNPKKIAGSECDCQS